MLHSFRNNRRKVQKKITSITAQNRRVQSPPSPSSFVSRGDIVDINEKLQSNDSLADLTIPAHSFNPDRTTSSPRVQLDLSYRTSTISDWFPSDLLGCNPRLPPELPTRNVSLPGNGNGNAVASGSGSGGTSVDGAAVPGPSAMPGPSAAGYTYDVFDGVDDVIVIEPERPEPTPAMCELGVESSDSDSDELPAADYMKALPRKPTPTPIKIPSNPTGSKITIQRSASAGHSAGPSSHLPLPLAPSSNAPSRPSSPGSAYTDAASAVSGTTLARALVDSFIVTNESRASRYRAGITRQDSATLPRGEHPSQYWRDRRGSPGHLTSPERMSLIPPVPPLPSSAELGSAEPDARGRSWLTAALEHRRNSAELPFSADAPARRTKDATALTPPISPILEGSSPAPSAPHTPVFANVSRDPSRVSLQSLHCRSTNTASDGSSPVSGPSPHQQASSEPGSAQERSGSPAVVERTEKRNSLKPSLDLARSFTSETDTTGSAYSMTSFERPGTSTTPGTSIKSPGSASFSSPSRIIIVRSRSESSSGHQNSAPGRPPLLPIGERPHSVQVPHSPSSPRTPSDTDLRARLYGMPAVPVSARLPGVSPVDSPDLLDFMFPVSQSMLPRERSGSEGLSPLAIAPPDMSPLHSASAESLSSMSASRQTFPETPYAFSPMWSPAPPPLPAPARGVGLSALPRTASVNRVGVLDMKMRLAQRSAALMRSTSASVLSPRVPRIPRVPPTPPLSAESAIGQPRPATAPQDARPEQHTRLSSIEESRAGSPPHTPSSSPSQWDASPAERGFREERSASSASLYDSDASTPAHSLRRHPLPALPTIPQSEEVQTLPRPSSDPESPLGSPPPSYAASPDASAGPAVIRVLQDTDADAGPSQPQPQSSVPTKRAHSPLPSLPLSAAPLPPPPQEERPMLPLPVPENPPPPYVEEMHRAEPPAPAPPPPARLPTISQLRQASADAPLAKRMPRTRPPLPLGPRNPSYSSASVGARSRNGSVSSFASNPGGAAATRKASTVALSATAPRFQPGAVRFKAMTMEAAQWTLTSQQLQDLVSTAIRQSSDPSAIRLLQLETYNAALPEEIRRLEGLSAEIRTNYKLGVRKRRTLLGTLTAMADGMEGPAMLRALEELTEVSDGLDQLSEELYSVTDQITRLTHLRDVHSSSALAMALRKLHSKVIKQLTETQRLQEQLAVFEADREDAWQQAHAIAQELDDLSERTGPPEQKGTEPSPSRRSSRVLVARKNSSRATKAGLRSSMHRRSHRSSTSSGVSSPASRTAAAGDIPPVPPIPMRNPLGIVTDLPTSSSMCMSDSPSSDLRAMIQAQKDICEMLGISPEELKVHPQRRQSWTAVFDARAPVAPQLMRRASEVMSVSTRTPGSAQTVFKMGSP